MGVLFLIVSTALVTWMVSTYVHSVYSVNQLYGSIFLSHSLSSSPPGKTRLRLPGTTTKDDNNSSNKSPNKKKKRQFHINMTNYDGPSRVFPVYEHPFPCFPGEDQLMLTTPAHRGILFQRPVKTGTTTVASIIMRLAHSRAKQQQQSLSSTEKRFEFCKHRANHGTARELEYAKRDRSQSFLFSVLRDPTAKAISRFFHFDVSVGQKEPTDEYFTKIMMRPYNYHAHLTDLMTTTPKPPLLPALAAGRDYTPIVQQVLDDYDFIVITERMDESLVVLKLLLGLEMKDILYIRARSSGSFSNGPGNGRNCVYLVPSFLTPGMERFFASEQWRRQIEGDILMYQAAYQSLDRTIDALGRDKVQRQLMRFRHAQRYAHQQCAQDDDKVVHMCNEGGKFTPFHQTTCYKWGEGCDHVCLNNLTLPKALLVD